MILSRWVWVLTAALAGCSGGESGGGGSGCPSTQPIQCKDPGGVVVGCCPGDHPVCSADGLSCLASGTGGTSGSGGSSATGGVGNTGNTGNGGTGATGTGANGGTGGGVGGAGGTGGATGGTGGTGGTPVPCDDVGFEPNEDTFSATDLGALSDCDGTPPSVGAKLDSNTDTDVYVFAGSDGGCFVDPTATTTDPVRVCMFADCSGVSVSCSAGSSTTFDGLPGCCSTNGSVSLGVDCNGISDDADIYLRVDQGPTGVCTDYSVTYHY